MPIKPRNDDPECCAALGRIAQTPDGPNWAEADPADALLAEKLIRYYWRFALNVAGQELKRQGTNTVPRSERYKVQEHREDYYDDKSGDDERPGDKYEPNGTGMYLADFESDVPRLIHKSAAAFASRRGRGKLAPIKNAARDWTKRRTVPGMNGRAADEPPEFNVAETFDSADLDALYVAADAEVLERVRTLTLRRDRTGATVLQDVWAGYSQAVVARKLGISESAVSQRISAARQLLPHFDEAMGVHRLAVKFVNNDGPLSEPDLSFLGEVRIRYRGGHGTHHPHSSPDVNPTLDRRPVKTDTKIIYPRWATTPKAPSHHGRTEVLFNPGMGEPIRVGDRHLLKVKFHHRSHLFNADPAGETEIEHRARKEFQAALPTPWKHGDGKCKMVQRKSEDHRPTYSSVNECATYLDTQGWDIGQVREKWQAAQVKRFDVTGGQELPEPASDDSKQLPVYQFARLKPQGHWKLPRPEWGAENEDVRRRYQDIRRGKTICRARRRWVNTADRLQLASEHARKHKLARLNIAVRRGKVWRTPKLEPAWAPELARYDCQTQTEWKVERIADHRTVHKHGAFRFWRTPLLVEMICAPPLQPPELVLLSQKVAAD